MNSKFRFTEDFIAPFWSDITMILYNGQLMFDEPVNFQNGWCDIFLTLRSGGMFDSDSFQSNRIRNDFSFFIGWFGKLWIMVPINQDLVLFGCVCATNWTHHFATAGKVNHSKESGDRWTYEGCHHQNGTVFQQRKYLKVVKKVFSTIFICLLFSITCHCWKYLSLCQKKYLFMGHSKPTHLALFS